MSELSSRLFGPVARVFFILAAVLTLSACDNTVRGVAQDVQETGQAVDDAAAGRP